MAQNPYPQNPKAWRKAIEKGLGMSSSEVQNAYQTGQFPFDELERWLHSSFNQGYSPDFLPALQRNMKGLVAWVYGNEGEPYWPGSDAD